MPPPASEGKTSSRWVVVGERFKPKMIGASGILGDWRGAGEDS